MVAAFGTAVEQKLDLHFEIAAIVIVAVRAVSHLLGISCNA